MIERVERDRPHSFEVVGLHPAPCLGVLLHVPHISKTILADVRAGILLSDESLQRELLLMTDHYTDTLFSLVIERRGVVLIDRLSRLVIDPERFPEDAMEAVRMGAVYRRTHDGRLLRPVDPDERTRLLAVYFEPYAHAATDLVAGLLSASIAAS